MSMSNDSAEQERFLQSNGRTGGGEVGQDGLVLPGSSGYGSLDKIQQTPQEDSTCTKTSTSTSIGYVNRMDSSDYSDATIGQVIASMTKNLVGCGALSLSNGIAYATNNKIIGCICGPFWIITLGAIFGYYCWLIGKICHITHQYTYRTAWEVSVGSNGSMAVSIANSLKAVLALLSYSTILTDTTLSLLPSIGLSYNLLSRTQCLLLITISCLVPLCLLPNIKVLAPFSILGTGGIVFTCIAMFIRWFDGSYQQDGYYIDTVPIHYQPYFGTMNKSYTSAILPYVCMVFEAFVMHYNSPRFYRELENRNLTRYGTTVGISFGASSIMYSFIAVFGFLTFGSNSNSMILNNYSPFDPLATVSRIAVWLSTITAYPIVFMGLRDGIFDICTISLVQQQERTHLLSIVTIALITTVTTVSIFIHDLGLINAVGGGLVATAIVFVFPTIMLQYIIVIQRTKQSDNIIDTNTDIDIDNSNDKSDAIDEATAIRYSNIRTTSSSNNNNNNNIIHSQYNDCVDTSSIESVTTIILAIVGVILGIVGAYIAVYTSQKHHDKMD